MKRLATALVACVGLVGCADATDRAFVLLYGVDGSTASAIDWTRDVRSFAADLGHPFASVAAIPRAPEWSDVGVGVRVARFGNETCAAAAVVVGDDSIAEFRAECRIRSGRTAALRKLLPSTFTIDRSKLEERHGYEWSAPEEVFAFSVRHAAVWDAVVRARAASLGAVAPAVVPEALRDFHAYLTSPFGASSPLGGGCGDGGAVPPHRTAMQALVAAGRWDLVREVLRGPNPTGRAYAANALWVNRQLDAADARVVRTLARESSGKFSVCHGCSYSSIDAQQFFTSGYQVEPDLRK